MHEQECWGRGHRLLYVVNESFFFYSHRMPIARAARDLGFEVHIAAPDDHVWAARDFTVADLEKEGFVFHTIPLDRRGMDPAKDLRTIWALLQLYRRLRPSLLHHLTIKPVLYGGCLARGLGVPGVINAVTGLGHLFTANDLKHRLLRLLIVRLYRFSMRNRRCRVIVQNREDGDTLLAADALAETQLHCIAGSGVSMEEFQPTDEVAGVPLVVLPARLIWAKGIQEFVDAAAIVKQRGIAARFMIMGDAKVGYAGAVPEAKLREWHASGVVEWSERREDMPEVFRQAHIVCLPTKYGEGVPRVLIEAAACGRAVVTTDVPGCRDIVRDGVNGLLVPPGDARALGAALERLLIDPELRQSLADRGRSVAEEGFAVEQVVSRTMAVYRDLLPPVPARH